MNISENCPLIYILIGRNFWFFLWKIRWILNLILNYFLLGLFNYRAREIRIIIGGQSTQQKKEIEVKISWDSNRDPTQEVNKSIFSNQHIHQKYLVFCSYF